jgi:membrane fusion protein (multidrug efflux system)
MEDFYMDQRTLHLPAGFVGAVFLVLVSGCDKKPAPTVPSPPQAGFITIKPQSVSWTTQLPGRTVAEMTADVRPQVNGVILKRLFTEGDDVTAGEQLYQIDASTYQASYDTARATLAYDQAALTTARIKAQRYKPLAAAKAISQQDYDDASAGAAEAVAQVASARASVEQAQINLIYTKVLSPISGHIGASSVTPGALVTASQTTVLATVTQLDPIYVDVEEPSTMRLQLQQGFANGDIKKDANGDVPVGLQLEDGSLYKLPGALQFTEVTVDENTGTVLLRATFRNPDHFLLPGMYVHAVLAQGVHQNGIVVPQQAVSHNTHGDATVLLVGAGNKVLLQIIETGAAVNNQWVVTSGLKAGDRVIIDGLTGLDPGMAVTPVAEAAPAITASN